MKKLVFVLIFLAFIIFPLVAEKGIFAIGIQGGLSGWDSEGMVNFAGLSVKISNSPMIFSLNFGTTRFGYSGFSTSLTADYLFKTFKFGSIDINFMNWYMGVGLNLGYGYASYYKNGDGSRNVFVAAPRFVVGYRYLMGKGNVEIYTLVALHTGVKFDIQDGTWHIGNSTEGYYRCDIGFDWDIPINMGIRFWIGEKKVSLPELTDIQAEQTQTTETNN
ncbi:MAG: hypothetical protein GX220_00270 [Treponema sp.]|jgi:hypothetical protein|nr:hypothetical protein [Treponema sp.]